jgi:hypothetical protein
MIALLHKQFQTVSPALNVQVSEVTYQYSDAPFGECSISQTQLA